MHSMRSLLDALPGKIRTIHLITADLPFTEEDVGLLPPAVIVKLESHIRPRDVIDEEAQNEPADRAASSHADSPPRISNSLLDHLTSTWRIAQSPTWLNFARRDPAQPGHPFHPASVQMLDIRTGRQHPAEASYPTLRYATHSEIFHLPSMERDFTEELGEREWKEKVWREKALPSFNSMSIESRIGWLPGLADVSLSLNDDFFLLRRHAVSDFHSPLYGSVIRFDHGYYQQVRPKLDKTRFNDAGEVGGLYHANYLLSQRFPKRLRPYFAHVPKVITRGLHHEASLMFKEALHVSSSRRFREMMYGEGDVQMQWLLSSLRVSTPTILGAG